MTEQKDTMTNLIDLVNLSPTGAIEITKTGDGHYLGRADGDIGFNIFIGQPSAPHEGPGLTRSLSIWSWLSQPQKIAVVALSESLGINLIEEFGIPSMSS